MTHERRRHDVVSKIFLASKDDFFFRLETPKYVQMLLEVSGAEEEKKDHW